jgi:hypothetical protein
VENPMPFELHILSMTDDPKKSPPQDIATPIKVTPSHIGWVELNLTSQEIKVEKDAAFYVSITWLYDNKPTFDSSWGVPRDSYMLVDNTWKRSIHNLQSQLIVSRTLEEPVKFIVTTTIRTTTQKLPTTTKETTIITQTTKSTPTTRTTIETTIIPTKPTTLETTIISLPAATITTTIIAILPDWVYGLIGLGFIIFILAIVFLIISWARGKIRRKAY